MSIKWNSSLETGFRQIDLQHQELVELINEAADAQTAGRDEAVLNDILPRLTAYVIFHFGTEEQLMASNTVSAAHAAAHRDAHSAFTQRIQAMKAGINAGESNLLAQLVAYLQEWLVAHIMKTDRELVQELGKKRA